MIAHVFGKIVEKFGSSVIVDVSGVGYEVQVSAVDFEKVELQTEVKLYTYHHIREQSEELFGFFSLASKKLFELLITVQGVGPKAALAILSLEDGEIVRNALAKGDVSFIARASGVGRKTAGRVVVDLSDKVGRATDLEAGPKLINKKDEALEALMALGFNLNDANLALDDVSIDLPVSERVKLALRNK